VGGSLAANFSEVVLRRCFATLLIVVAVRMLVK
jgi:uncharacterized membrane protein YfcA